MAGEDIYKSKERYELFKNSVSNLLKTLNKAKFEKNSSNEHNDKT